jgi:hypothetical protein
VFNEYLKKSSVLLSEVFLLVLILTFSSSALANETYSIPKLVSFEFSPTEIELNSSKRIVSFELIVFHPTGIENSVIDISLKSSTNDSLSLSLRRTDFPINLQLTNVTFRGDIEIPTSIKNGAYTAESGNVIGISPLGSTAVPRANNFKVTKSLNKILGAEDNLIIRRGGYLNLDFKTFVGPSHVTNLVQTREYPNLLNYKIPIWKVGEAYNPLDYFELKVPSLELNITSKTNSVCEVENKILKFKSEGDCNFIVSTPQSKDYSYKQFEQIVQITSSRNKQELSIQNIDNQLASNLPRIINIPRVYTIANGYLIPKNLTPEICQAEDGYVNLLSHGTCRFTYQSKENQNFLASKVYEISFNISRSPQTINFDLAQSISLDKEIIGLKAVSSSGGEVNFSTITPSICKINVNMLELKKSGICKVTATQIGTELFESESVTKIINIENYKSSPMKTISCTKKNLTKKVIKGVNPKCPIGYKIK